MKKIRVVLESDDGKKIGWILDPQRKRFVSGTFGDDLSDIVEVSQEDDIINRAELVRQIAWTIKAGLSE